MKNIYGINLLYLISLPIIQTSYRYKPALKQVYNKVYYYIFTQCSTRNNYRKEGKICLILLR